ncbi:hypothetical protein GPZ77_34280 (plasmid) [Streptomyces sp. QHH-9511]|nr:hypothetical protein [Streptomyces sp. QHH-9511]QGZ53300.1 hypothetical protein GPZ77_34280 [Streptomyces sp. QHH-9511]
MVLFIALQRFLRRISPWPPALHDFCVDSGGFTELQKHGRWRITAAQYVALIRRIRTQLGPDRMLWAAPQDYMCEEAVIRGGWFKGQHFVGTRELRGLKPGDPEQDLTTAVRIHQRLTVANALELRRLAPDIPFILVLQGNRFEDYKHCARLYTEAGIDLAAEPVIGLGSVCRRENTEEIAEIVDYFHGQGIKLHGFGVKTGGLGIYGDQLVSADSQAWSYGYRKRKIRLPQCTHQAKTCANCKEGALAWYRRICDTPPSWRQMTFDVPTAA